MNAIVKPPAEARLFDSLVPVHMITSWLAAVRVTPTTHHVECVRASDTGFTVGDRATLTRVFSVLDFFWFALVSGDWNPVHTNYFFAAASPFKREIAHGMLIASTISAILGTTLPGKGTIYTGQTLHFTAPVYRGDTVVTEVEIIELLEKGGATLSCVCRVGEKVVIIGEATVKLPRPSAH